MAVVVGCLPGFCKDWGPLACQTLMELWHKGCIPQHQACCKEAEGVFIHYKNVPFSLSSFRQNKQEQNPVCFSSSWGTVPFQSLIFGWLLSALTAQHLSWVLHFFAVQFCFPPVLCPATGLHPHCVSIGCAAFLCTLCHPK